MMSSFTSTPDRSLQRYNIDVDLESDPAASSKVDSYHNSVTWWQLLMCCGKLLLAIAVGIGLLFFLLCMLFYAGYIGP
ncbi:hypothetical protein TrLO_g2091 [Triparma laevis f. longispina]|uniref:Uncharacterized protein n=1 Tax=Triparma laevis f. longispina TaxID=1714387 RepID=A0A9W7FL39_9STRA|nr:hypothetical protein TrLO_g2091 [Triparma laevis f. longispina]